MKNLARAVDLVAVIVLVSGCGGIGAALIDDEANSAGAQKIFPEDTNVEKVNIFMLLDPSKPVDPLGCCVEDEKDPPDGERYREVEEALEAFYTRTSDKPDADKKLMRTRVQERIVAASNQRCENFKKKLQQYEGTVNFLFGALTTGLAGAGAITTATSTARILSGLAGISSGTRAEFNSDYFKNLSIEVVTKGLTARREVMLQSMRRNWNLSLNEYSVEAAIGDALNYHGACTVIAGLEEASDSISTVSDPGLTTLTRAFEGFGEARRALDGGVARSTRSNVSPLTSYAQADKALQTLEREKSILTAATVPTVQEVSDPGIALDDEGKAKKTRYDDLVATLPTLPPAKDKLLTSIDEAIGNAKKLVAEEKKVEIAGLEMQRLDLVAQEGAADSQVARQRAVGGLIQHEATMTEQQQVYDNLRDALNKVAQEARTLAGRFAQARSQSEEFKPN